MCKNKFYMFLLLAGVEVLAMQEIETDKVTALHKAAAEGDGETINAFMRDGVDITVLDENKRTLVHTAAKNGNASTLRALLATGKIDIKEKDDELCTALHLAVREGNSKECVEMILERAIQDSEYGYRRFINKKNLWGRTASDYDQDKTNEMWEFINKVALGGFAEKVPYSLFADAFKELRLRLKEGKDA